MEGNVFSHGSESIKDIGAEWNQLLAENCWRVKLKRFSKGYVFRPYEENWYLTCAQDEKSNVRVVCETEEYQPGIVYFKTEMDAENAVENIGRKVLAKEYFKIWKS